MAQKVHSEQIIIRLSQIIEQASALARCASKQNHSSRIQKFLCLAISMLCAAGQIFASLHGSQSIQRIRNRQHRLHFFIPDTANDCPTFLDNTVRDQPKRSARRTFKQFFRIFALQCIYIQRLGFLRWIHLWADFLAQFAINTPICINGRISEAFFIWFQRKSAFRAYL